MHYITRFGCLSVKLIPFAASTAWVKASQPTERRNMQYRDDEDVKRYAPEDRGVTGDATTAVIHPARYGYARGNGPAARR